MSKRKLTQKQQARVLKAQERILKKAHNTCEIVQEKSGVEEHGRIISHHGVFVDVEDAHGKILRCRFRQHCLVAVGDFVVFRRSKNDQGVVEAIKPRKTIIEKANERGQMRPLAANIDQVCITLAPQPAPTLSLLDRCLVACQCFKLEPLIVFNKIDLLEKNKELRELFQAQLVEYEKLGYPICFVSAYTQEGLFQLKHYLNNKTSIFIGQSGVGKSSLVNSLIPNASVRVGELTAKTALGAHTTSWPQLLHLPEGGDLIDSPGIRDFGLWPMSQQELYAGFPELAALAKNCRFRNCSHLHEPGCAVLQALEEGKILAERLQSFYDLSSIKHYF